MTETSSVTLVVMKMQAGDYNQPFEIVEMNYTIDEWGDQYPDPKPIYRGFAKVTNLSGKEYWDAYSILSENVLRFACRWSRRFERVDTQKHFLRWKGRILDIIALDNVAYGNSQCVIKCKESTHA